VSPQSTNVRPRLKERYLTELAPALQSELGLGNVMQVPRMEKIVLNCGVGRATQQASLLDGAVADLTLITGQKPLITRAKKSIAGFKLREGNAIGAKATLRGDRMWEFYDRLVSIAIPRIRDFPWPEPELLRRPGELHLRRHRATDLSRDRLRQDRHRPRDGHHHRHHGHDRRPGPGIAPSPRFPVPPRRAELGVSQRWQRKPSSRSNSARRSSRCAGTRGVAAVAAPVRCTSASACAASASAPWSTPAKCPA